MIVVRLLGWLLVPWTALLASVDARAWFPRPAIKWAWVVFDAALAGGFYALSPPLARRPRARSHRGDRADAVLTLFEGIAWNAPRTAGIGARALLALAMAAPVAGFATLWRARVWGRPARPQRRLMPASRPDRR